MTLPPVADRWTLDAANAERHAAIAAFGFTERQANFLLHVLLHAGVFVERRSCAFAGIVHGQKSTDFIRALVDRRLATPITVGKLHRGRMVHVHYKPLWAAIGEPDNRFRKPAAPGRLIERVMLLDAVLNDHETVWLGPATDKRRYFMRELADRVELQEFPHLRFGTGPEISIRYFPDKLPIGVHVDTGNHVFAYLVAKPSPMDFRLFLLRHAGLFQGLRRWTIRLLVPRPLSKATRAYLHAAREHLATPVPLSVVETMAWLFTERKRLAEAGAEPPHPEYVDASKPFRAPRYRALYEQWLADPDNTLWTARSTLLADALSRGEGQVECVELSRQYLHLSPLLAIA